MKELLNQYASYHFWANKQLLDVVLKLTATQQQQPIESSFGSIYSTLLHILDAESIWWQRLKLTEHIIKPSDTKTFTTDELVAEILVHSQQWQNWVSKASDVQLQHVFAYQNNKKEQFKQPIYQMLLHLFNHGTFHRGQLVTMFRQLKITKIPSTDFVTWARKK
jgi:uncharacterized damage-inducible protein DinB